MSKFICFITGYPSAQGFRRFEFIWDEKHACYVFRGKEFTEAEFNEITKAVFTSLNYRALVPQIRCIDQTPAAAPAAPVENLDDPLSLDQALAIVKREAPELLKKKPGPRQPDLLPTG